MFEVQVRPEPPTAYRVMSEIYQIILTSALTVVGGVVVITMGQLAIKFWIEPLHELRGLIGEIDFSLTYFAPQYSSPIVMPGSSDLSREQHDQARAMFRGHAGQLRAKSRRVLAYGLSGKLGLVPPRAKVFKASENLIGLSNSVFAPNTEAAERYITNSAKLSKEIMELLRIVDQSPCSSAG